MRKIAISVAAATACLIAGTAQAEGKPSFKEADKDGNGKVSIEEAKKAGIPEAEAKKEDLDNDGALTQKDWQYVEVDPEPAPGQGGGQPGGGQPGGGQPGGGQPGM